MLKEIEIKSKEQVEEINRSEERRVGKECDLKC